MRQLVDKVGLIYIHSARASYLFKALYPHRIFWFLLHHSMQIICFSCKDIISWRIIQGYSLFFLLYSGLLSQQSVGETAITSVKSLLINIRYTALKGKLSVAYSDFVKALSWWDSWWNVNGMCNFNISGDYSCCSDTCVSDVPPVGWKADE
jgi:hypothetical protein